MKFLAFAFLGFPLAFQAAPGAKAGVSDEVIDRAISALSGFSRISDDFLPDENEIIKEPMSLVTGDFNGNGKGDIAVLAWRAYREGGGWCIASYSVLLENHGNDLRLLDTSSIEGRCTDSISAANPRDNNSFLGTMKKGVVPVYKGEERVFDRNIRIRWEGLLLRETITGSERLIYFDGRKFQKITIYGGSC